MTSFRSGRLAAFSLPVSTVWLLTAIAEAKGRQELYTKQSPQLLQALRATALIQSVESSNRIEGVTVAPDRLRPLVEGSARPRDRSEEEIQGYRRALNLIHSHASNLIVSSDLFQRLHKTIQEGGGDAGQWKRVSNEIVELRPGQPPRPLPASPPRRRLRQSRNYAFPINTPSIRNTCSPSSPAAHSCSIFCRSTLSATATVAFHAFSRY